MALFTDGPFVTAEDLNVIDGEFIKLASQAGIIVDSSPQSLLTHSTLSAGSELQARFQNFSGYLVGVGVASNHLAAVLNVLSTAINRPRAFLQQIPVSEPNPTRDTFIRWVRYFCLRDFYQNLYFRNVKEQRFKLKMEHFELEKDRKWGILRGNGIPVVLSPFSCPGAVWDYGSGVWSAANVGASASSGTAGGTFQVAITWVNSANYQSQYNPIGGESGPSVILSQVVGAGNALTVNINNLNPPTGIMQPLIGTAQGVYPPQSATNWNVYVGESTGPLFLQNPSPIPIGTTSYTLPGDPNFALTGFQLTPGQAAQYDFTVMNTLWRG